MRDITELIGLFTVLFSVSFGFAYAYTALRRAPKTAHEPAEFDIFRLRSATGMFRVSFLGVEEEGWAVGAPLMRDSHVPLRVGDRLTVEAPHPHGARIFKTEVVARKGDPNRFILKVPTHVMATERRSEARLRNQSTRTLSVEGEEARFIDVSSRGARLMCRREFLRGERVRVDVAGIADPVFGWVLDSRPNGLGSETRLVFEEPIKI